MISRALGAGLTAGALASTGLLLGSAAMAASPTGIVGSGSFTEQSYFCDVDGPFETPRQADVVGPERTPFGSGSHRMVIGESDSQTEQYRTNAYDGTKLSDLTRLDYSTYASSDKAANPQRAHPYLRLTVDDDGDGTADSTLFFFPANNEGTHGNGQQVNDAWRDWSTINGQWGQGGDANYTTLADYAAAHPDAELVDNGGAGAITTVIGCGEGGSNDTMVNGRYFVDRLVVGTTGGATLFDLGQRGESSNPTDAVVTDPQHLHGWVSQAFDAGTGDDYVTNQKFVRGPGNPPAGVGSLRLSIADNSDRVEQFRTAAYDGRLLRDLRDLSYSTFQRPSGGNTTPQQPAYLRLNISTDGDNTMEEQLYFIPSNNGDIQQSTWQTWDTAAGIWNINGDDGAGSSRTLERYLVAHPDARIVNNGDGSASGGGLTFQVGASGDNQRNGQFYVDKVLAGFVDQASGQTDQPTRYDLEPQLPVVSIGDAEATEGNSSNSTLTFQVSLDGVQETDVVVPWHTEDGSAESGQDYTAQSGNVTIPAGATSANVTVDVLPDMTWEKTQRMHVVLGDPDYGTIGDGDGVGVIRDDDTRVDLGVTNGKGHRIRGTVDTTPAAAHLPVSLVGGPVGGSSDTLYNGNLDDAGHLSKLLRDSYSAGTKVEVRAKVFTTNGTYKSDWVTIKVD